MDPRRLLIFRSVARAGSLGAAARDLGWTQPAVSQHMAKLERDVGHPLLLRRHDGISLTEAGLLLLARADDLAATLSMAEKEQAQLGQLASGTVRIAAYPSAAATILPPALARLRDLAPDVEPRLTEAEPPLARALLQRDEIDIALVFSYNHDEGLAPAEMRTHALADEPVRLVTASSHPFAHQSLTPADLADEEWIAGCERCRGHLVDLAASAGYEARIRHSTDDYVAAQYLVAAGLGITLLPQAALDAFTHPGVAVHDSRHWGTRRVFAVTREGGQSVPAVRAFFECLCRA